MTAASTVHAYVSAWTNGTHGAGDDGGMHVFAAGRTTFVPVARYGDGRDNIGYFAIDATRHRLIALDERKRIEDGSGAGSVIEYAVVPGSGELRETSRASSIGPNPSYVAVKADDGLIAVANHGNTYHAAVRLRSGRPSTDDAPSAELAYDDGSVTLLHDGSDDGSELLAQWVEVTPAGSGPDQRHQRSSHPHSSSFDPTGRMLIVCDKGTDAIHVYAVSLRPSRLELRQSLGRRARTAPRHVLFHPRLPVLYVVHELDSSIDVFTYDAEETSITYRISTSTTQRSSHPDNHPADIAIDPDGRRLVVCNRGEDSVMSYTLDPATGFPTPATEIDAGGSRPRAINIHPDGAQVFIVCTDSDSITRTTMHPHTAALSQAETVAQLSRPTRIEFLAVDAGDLKREEDHR